MYAICSYVKFPVWPSLCHAYGDHDLNKIKSTLPSMLLHNLYRFKAKWFKESFLKILKKNIFIWKNWTLNCGPYPANKISCLNILESTLHKDVPYKLQLFCQMILRRLFKNVNKFSIILNDSSPNKRESFPSFQQTWISFTLECFGQSLIKTDAVGLGKNSIMWSVYRRWDRQTDGQTDGKTNK